MLVCFLFVVRFVRFSFEDDEDEMIEIVIRKDFEIEGGMKSNTLTLDVCPTYSILQIKTLIRSLWPIPVKLNEK